MAILTRDETEPLRQEFLFGEVGVFYTSQNQKDIETSYQNNGGYPVAWSDMPVVSPFDGQTFFENFHSIMGTQSANEFLSMGNMPVPEGFDQMTVVSQQQVVSMLPGIPTYLVRAVLSKDGKAAQGMFIASPYPDAYGHGTAYIVAGITAPTREFNSIKSSLTGVLNSLQMDSSYVQNGVNTIQENGERFKEISQTISETSDIIIKGYEERNKLEDVRIEKEGDQIMDVERIYDPNTGEVYEVENGYYDYYNIHREDYPKNNLQQLPDNDFNLWGEAPSINHSYVKP